jgi:hypothetical protein
MPLPQPFVIPSHAQIFTTKPTPYTFFSLATDFQYVTSSRI